MDFLLLKESLKLFERITQNSEISNKLMNYDEFVYGLLELNL